MTTCGAGARGGACAGGVAARGGAQPVAERQVRTGGQPAAEPVPEPQLQVQLPFFLRLKIVDAVQKCDNVNIGRIQLLRFFNFRPSLMKTRLFQKSDPPPRDIALQQPYREVLRENWRHYWECSSKISIIVMFRHRFFYFTQLHLLILYHLLSKKREGRF